MSLTSSIGRKDLDRERLKAQMDELGRTLASLQRQREAIERCLAPQEPLAELRRALELLRVQYPHYALLYHFRRVLRVSLDRDLGRLFPPGAFLKTSSQPYQPSRATLIRCLRHVSQTLRIWVSKKTGLGPSASRKLVHGAIARTRRPSKMQRNQIEALRPALDFIDCPKEWNELKPRDWRGNITLRRGIDHLEPPAGPPAVASHGVLLAIRYLLGLDHQRELSANGGARGSMCGLVLLGLGHQWEKTFVAASPDEVSCGDAWLDQVDRCLFTGLSGNIGQGWEEGWWPWMLEGSTSATPNTPSGSDGST